MKDRILIVEDRLINQIGAFKAFREVAEARAEAVVNEAIEAIDMFKPTVALVDMHIIGGLGTQIGKVLREKGIPYVYVTGIGDTSHNILEAIEIQKEDEDGNMVTLARFDKTEKDAEIWEVAYKLAKIEN